MTPTKSEQEEFDRLFEQLRYATEWHERSVPVQDNLEAIEALYWAREYFGDYCLQHRGKTFRLPGQPTEEAQP